MTQQEYQDLLHALYQGDVTTPDVDSADWNTRQKILEASIRTWAKEKGVYWRELWVLLSDSTDEEADKTTDGTAGPFDCPDDFVRVGGFVRVVNAAGQSAFYAIKEAHEAELFANATIKACMFTGNKKVGFSLTFNSAPVTGLTIEYPYYKSPFFPTTEDHVMEMSDPMLAIYLGLAGLHENDGQGDRATLAMARASAILSGMKTNNIMPAWYQDNKDSQAQLGKKGFGR